MEDLNTNIRSNRSNGGFIAGISSRFTFPSLLSVRHFEVVGLAEPIITVGDLICALGPEASHPSCFKNQDPEKYCLNHNDPAFCKTIGDICDADGFVKPEDAYCTNRS